MSSPEPTPNESRPNESRPPRGPLPGTGSAIYPNAHWPDPRQTRRLSVLIEATVHRMLMDHPAPVVLDLDVDPSMPVPAEPSMVSLILESLVRSSLAEMPDGGAIDIAAVRTDRGVELEVADTGPPAAERQRNVPLVVAQVGGTLDWRDCPTGGTAATVRFPPRAADASEPSLAPEAARRVA